VGLRKNTSMVSAQNFSSFNASRLALLATDVEGGPLTVEDIEGVLRKASATIPLPPCDVGELKTRLWDEDHIEIPLSMWGGQPHVRVSVQGYNTRADVEKVRGVACGEMVRQLMEKGLVRVAGRHDSLGRPQLYGTTKRFLQVFGLNTLKDLPEVEALKVGERGA